MSSKASAKKKVAVAPSGKGAYTGRIAIGLNKGLKIAKRPRAVRSSNRKGVVGKRARFVKELIREVSGYAPYERRIMELCRNGLDKRALKLAKKKVGSLGRAKTKKEELQAVIRKTKR